MKKNLLLVLGITFAFGASAQVSNKHSLNFENKPIKTIDNIGGYYNFSKDNNNNFTAKAGGDVLWSEDFTLANGWVFDNQGQTAANTGWDTVTTTRSWATQYNIITKKILSTSGGNFLEVVNGKIIISGSSQTADSPINVIYTATSPIISVPSPNVTVRFLQYGALFNDSQTMEVSVDGNNWIEVFSNNDRKTQEAYLNPELAEANLGLAGLPAATTSLQFRFKFTSRYSTETTPMAWLAMGWMIDDIEVVENYSADLKLQEPLVTSEGVRYSKVPAAQGHQVAVLNSALNNGIDTLTDVMSYVKMTTPTGESIDTLAGNPLLASYIVDSIVHTFNLTDLGTYKVSDFGVYFNGTDEVPGNDTSNYSFALDFGGDIYALDLGGTPNSYDYETENLEYRVGNVFDMYADAEVTGIDIFLYASGNTKSTVGTEIYGAVREYQGAGDNPLLARTENYGIFATDNNKWITLVFEEPVQLYKDATYIATVETYGSGSTDANVHDMVIGFSGESLRGSSLAYYASGSTTQWYIAGTGGTPMVRMNFTPGIVSTSNLNESLKVNIYPNPAKDAAVIDYNTAFDGNVTVSVVDLSGRTVYTNTFANQTAGNNKVELNTSDFNAGVYQVVINANSSTVTKKLVIR